MTSFERTAVKERPILFSGAMIRALLSGAKTQTRRIVKPQPPDHAIEVFDWRAPDIAESAKANEGCYYNDMDGLHFHCKCPYGSIGDRLWVRESWAPMSSFDPSPETGAVYKADDHPSQKCIPVRWTPSIHMPRWASRITLEITGVRVERLNEISQPDIAKEGIDCHPTSNMRTQAEYQGQFRSLWESINGAGS